MPLADYATFPRRTAGFKSGFGPVQRPSTPQGATWTGDVRQWAHQVVEKVRTATVGGRIRFLPWYDPYTEESPEIRSEYRKMLIESSVKAAFQTKILSVISLDVQCQSPDDDDPRQVQAAQFCSYAFRKIRGGMRRVGWSVLHPALVDGHSVCEKVWNPDPETSGPFRGKRIFHAVKAKDTRYLQLGIDPYRNVTAIRGMGFNAGRVWSPSDFIVFSYMELFENPAGTSDFRAAYRPYWIKNTTWQLRSLHLDKFTGPYLKGTYATQDQKDALETALQDARATTWLTVPIGAAVEAIDLSMRGTADFDQAIKDCDREILIAIVGAHLQILEGQTSGARGNTKVHKETSELIQWFLAASLADIYREQLATPLIEENFHGVEPPDVSVGAITEEAMLERLKVDQGLKLLGLKLSERDTYKSYSRPVPEPDDVLQAPTPQAQQPAPGGDAAGASPFSEGVRRFCMEGENKGMPGPCPLPEKHEGGAQPTATAKSPEASPHAAQAEQWLAKADLPDDVKREYAGHMTAVLGTMPDGFRKAALEAVAEFGGSMNFHASVGDVTAALEKATGKKERSKVGGFVEHHPGGDAVKVHLDGGAGNTPGETAQGIYAHEMGHAADAGRKFSDDPKWQSVWKSEIKSGKNLLSRYAMESPVEGFAELHRAICQKGIDAVRAKWPKCCAFLASKGLI